MGRNCKDCTRQDIPTNVEDEQLLPYQLQPRQLLPGILDFGKVGVGGGLSGREPCRIPPKDTRGPICHPS